MENKRYYWLKLREDFFSNKTIKKLRKLSCGDTGAVIYLKMQLLAMKEDGFLRYTGLEDSFSEELALDLDEDLECVTVVVDYLVSCHLMETSDNVNFFIPSAVENVGSESSSTKRVQEYRKRQKTLQCNNDVTPMKRNSNGEIEIRDRDKRKEIDKDNSLFSSPIVEENMSESSAFADDTYDSSTTYKPEKVQTLSINHNQSGNSKKSCSENNNIEQLDTREIITAWNGLGLAQISTLKVGTKRYTMLRARLNEHGSDSIFQAIDNIRCSAFLRGQNNRGWMISFDWLVKPNNFIKVFEGQYADRQPVLREPSQTAHASTTERIQAMIERGEFKSPIVKGGSKNAY